MKRHLTAWVAVVVVAAAAVVWRAWTRPFRGFSGTQIVTVDSGARATSVARLLVERGALRTRWPFLLRYALGRPWHLLKAGEYLFDRPMTPLDIYRKLIQGDVYLHTVVIPEGSDRFDIARILQEQLEVKPEEFLRVTEQVSLIRDLDPHAPSLEGYLFPDTYRFARGVTSATVVATMLSKFRRVFEAKFSDDLLRSKRTLHDVVTLASMVEKETSDPAERPLIAGVFIKRLDRGWALQCDPAVIYAARLDHRHLGRPIGPITQSDLKFDSSFNTYRNPGLPPGPISNPGEASFSAALNPETGKFFYFVSNNQGSHVFARTLAEHQRNVARYRRQVAALRRGTPDLKRHAQ